jgi:DNA-binding SARP family transcriptional activator
MIRYEVEPINPFFHHTAQPMTHNQNIMLLRLLDTPRLERDQEQLEIPPTKPAALLLHLAYKGDWVNRESLADVFAPDGDETSARHHVRVLLNRARQFGWSAGLEVEPTRLRFKLETDVQAFREAIGHSDWARAVSLYQRPLLDGFAVGAPGFEAWLEAERDSMNHAWREAALRHARNLNERGNHTEAAWLLTRVLKGDDLAEDVLAAYLEAAYLAGQRDEALRVYERFCERLRDELDLDPLETTQHLAERIRRAEALPTVPDVQPIKPDVPLRVQRPPILIGRDTERAILHDPNARLVLISGEPGAGKTRLMADTLPNARWLRCREGLDGVPYQPVIELLRSNLNALPELGPYREDLARLIPELMPGVTIGPAEPQSAKARLLEAFARTLEAIQTPLVADDLQWADAATLELLVFLAARNTVRLICAYRSTEVAPNLNAALHSLRSSLAHEIKLRGLGPDDVRALLAHLIGLDVGPERFANWLCKASGGNVFFALEILRALFENGTLEERDGVWHSALDEITRDYTELAVPSRVAQVVERRVLRLSEPTRRVLQAASVIREGFSPKLLSGVVGLSEFAVLDALEEAEGAGLVVNARFQHDLTRQSVYRNLTDARRKILHLRVAEGLDGIGEAMVIAQHWLEAEQYDQAIARFLDAARTYQSHGLVAEALELIEAALKHARDADQGAQLKVRRAGLLGDLGQFEAAAQDAQAALEHTEHTTDAGTHSLALAVLVSAKLHMGKVNEAQSIVEQHPDALERVPGETLASSLLLSKTLLWSALGQHERIITALEPELEYLRTLPPGLDLVSLLITFAATHDNLRRNEEALPLHREAIQLARRLGAKHLQVNASVNHLVCCWMLGRTLEGVPDAEEALGLGEYMGTPTLRLNLAVALATEQPHRAIELLEVSLQRDPNSRTRLNVMAQLNRLYAATGNAVRASEILDQAIDAFTEVEVAQSRAAVILAALRRGTPDQRERIQPYLDTLDRAAISPKLRDDLAQELGETLS